MIAILVGNKELAKQIAVYETGLIEEGGETALMTAIRME